MRKVPSVVIAGSAKSGTSSLFDWIGQHPEVSPALISEPGYFSGETSCASIEEYASRFFPAWRGEGHTLEATPFYLFYPPAAQRIADANPDCKIIIIVRNPVDAIYSWYWHQRRSAGETRSFESVIESEISNQNFDKPVTKQGDYLRRFDYPVQIERFLEKFGAANTLIVGFQALSDRPEELMRVIEEHLGISNYAD